MDETFAILIESKSRFETGTAGGFWLDMPATKEQLHAAMESVGITANNPQDFFIRGYMDNEHNHIALPHDLVCASDIDELNFLAARLAELDPAEIEKLNAAVQSKMGFENVGQIIDFTYNTDYFIHVPEAHTARELGDYYLNKSGAVQMPEEWKGGIDLAMFGQHAAEREDGAFTQYGYITKSGDEWERHFEGRDVPEEYRIMSYPQPARLDPEKVEFDTIATRQAAVLTTEPPEAIPVKPIIPTATDPNGKLKEITDRLEQGIADLFNSERFKEYLNVMSKFHNYSFNNTVLIALQKPDASLVMGFNAWKGKGIERNVKKGEQGIRIFAPAPYKIKTEAEKLDPDTKKLIIGEDGKPITETKEITIPAFKVVCVYDVSQTEGKELPTLGVDELLGSVENYKDFFAALEETSPVPIAFEQIEGGAHGYYHLEDKRIALDEGMSERQTLKTAIHEIAHAKLHDIDLNAPAEERANRPDRRTREVEAESVAYTVCQHYGLDTSDYSFGYVAGWSSGREMSELKSSLETIRATAAEIIDSIDSHIAEIQKEREAAPPELDPKGEPTVTIIWSENGKLRDGETMPLSRANALFEALDAQNKDTPGYDKTKFRLDFTLDGKPETYEGRQDLGDGEGSLIDHIEKFNAYYLNNEEWQNQLLRSEGHEAMEADKATRELLVGEVVPYLRLHCNLSEMEQAAKSALHNTASLTPIDTAYFTAITEYVAECRAMLNSGTYELPEAPKRSDFDPELQAYKEQVKAEVEKETYFEIYQIANTEQTAEIVFEPYDRLIATGHTVDPANYELVYAAPLTPDMTLEDIFIRFNIDIPEDYTGRSLSLSDVVVLHQDGDVSAHYVDSVGFREVPQFLDRDKAQVIIPGDHTTGEKITTPRGSFSVTDMTREQMEAAGYGVHHTSEDGKHLIMGNGTQAFAVAAENPIKHVEDTIEQNDNKLDGIVNNTPETPTVDALEAKVKAGEAISLVDLANAIKAEEKGGKGKPKEEKQSIRAQLKKDAGKEKAAPKKAATKKKNNDLEV